MSRLAFSIVISAVLLVTACAESTQESLDSSVATAVAQTVSAHGTPTQLPGVEFGPPATSIFCPGCQLVDVTGVVDGDTIDTNIGRVRFFGVDTPERGEACYTEATEFTRLLVGNQVRLEDGPRLEDTYGRRLAYVYDASGNSLNVQLIAAGYAKAWTRDGQHRDVLVGLEANAKANKAGCLWASIEKASISEIEPQQSVFDPVEHLADFILNRDMGTTHVFGLTNDEGDEVYFASGRSGLPSRRNTSAWLAENLGDGTWLVDTVDEIYEVCDSREAPVRLWP